MQKSSIKIENFSEHLFWDVDRTKLDFEKNKRLIIERAFTRGDIADIKIVITYYGLNTIKEEIIKAGFLDKKTLNWVSLFLDIPKTKFRCYTKIQSKTAHWNS
ncbi:MAG: hypothetical protein L3J56_05760 [Bacteroidales bacterium]|nr:hypothetical protein [Bacteroidales bacterium]